MNSKTTDPVNDRRKHWRDRRSGSDRRSPARHDHDAYDCRSGLPRRESDLGGDLDDGEVWWEEFDSRERQPLY